MEPILSTFVLLLLAQAIAPVPVQWQSSQCSRTCRSDPSFVRFDAHKTYEYRVQTTTQLDDQQQFQLDARAQLSVHSPCELSLQIRSARLQGIAQEEAQLLAQELEAEPISFGYDDGVVTDVCPSANDEQWSVDVKKAVISALQMSSRSLHEPTTVYESDVMGDACRTLYEPQARGYATAVLRKTKALNSCQNRQLADIGLFPRAFAASQQAWPLMNATYECVQTLDKDLVSGATCRETQQLRGYGTRVVSNLNIRLQSQTSGLLSGRAQTFQPNKYHLLMSSRFQESAPELSAAVRAVCQHLESETHEKSVESFPELVRALSQADRKTIERVAKQVQDKEICSNNQMHDLFLDASALSGSEGGAHALKEAFDSHRMSSARANYLFSLLAFSSRPSAAAAQILVPLLRSASTPKHVVLGISGLVHNLKAVKGNGNEAKDAISALVERLNQKEQRVATIKALQNIGLEQNQKARQALVALAVDSRQSDAVRSAALKALAEAMDSRERQQIVELFARTQESNEVRINAYKAIVMSGAQRQDLQTIKEQIRKDHNKDIQQFVRSHQKNLRESSDPHKKYTLPSNAPQFEEPNKQWFGVSNNFESSFMVDALSMGVAFEADVINSKDSTIPRSMTANLTVPAFGRELQLIEVEIRQKGFESVIKEKMRQLKHKSGESLFRQMMTEAIDIISSMDQFANSLNSRDLQMQVHIKVDGKTILSLDGNDAKQDWQQMWNRLRQQMDQRVDIDRAFAIQPINTRIQLPSTNGLPIVVRLNATLVSSLKASAKVSDWNRNSNSKFIEALIQPSFGLQMEAGVEFSAKSQKKAVEVVSRLTSSPVWDSKVEIRDNRIANVKINLPKDRQSLVRIESQFYERDASGQRKAIYQNKSYNQKKCTETAKKALGLQICAEFSSQAYEVTIEKSDRSMKAFEFSIESPPKGSAEVKNYRIAFNTPNSEVDRELSAELQIQTPSSGRQSAKVEVRSPWIRYSVEAGYRNEDKEQSVQLDVQKDGRKAFSLDLGLESQQRGQKREYRPRLRIQMSPQSEAIQMQGSVSVSKGRKNQLQIQLEGNQKQFLKGSFVREGERKSSDIRVSHDLTANLPGLELRVTGVAEKSAKHAETDLTVEYRVHQSRKESLKVSMKVQNLTQSQLRKVSAFGELTSTQFPQANFHLAYNLLAKPEQQVENELTVAWTQQLNNKIHVLHVTKLSQQNHERKLENTLSVEATPLGVNYELRANADVTEGQGNSGPQYSAEVQGKDRSGRKDNDWKAQFAYKHVSQAPLHLTLEATVKSQGRDYQYKDELRERAQGEYEGHSSWQWARGQKADFDYNYKKKSALHHEMDAQITTEKHVMKHAGMLKMSRDAFQVKSKLSRDDHELYALDSFLSRNRIAPSQIEAHAYGYAVKAAANSAHELPQLASFEVWTPNARVQQFAHKTNVEFVPRSSIALKSDTKRNNRQVLAIDAHVSRTAPSRLVVTSEPIDGRLDCDLISDRKSAALALNSQLGDWTHASSWASTSSSPQFEIKSKTVSKGKPIVTLSSQWSPRDNSFLNIEVPQQKSALNFNVNSEKRQRSGQLEVLVHDLKHKTDFQFSPLSARIESKSDRNRRLIHSLDYSHNNGVHSLDSELFQDYKISGEAQPWSEEPFVRLSGQKKSSQFETSARIQRKQNQIVFESKSKRNGNNLNQINALLSPSLHQQSQLSFETPQIRASIRGTPSQSGQFEWECPQYSHKTSGQWKDADYALDSKSSWKARNQFLNLVAKHAPLRMSRFSAQSHIGNLDFELDNQQKAKLAIEAKHPNYQFNHVSEVTKSPNQWQLESRTDKQQQNLFALKTRVARSGSPVGELETQIGQHWSAKARAQPQQWALEAKHPQWSHVSTLDVNDAKQWSLKSRTDDIQGRPIAKVDAFLAPQQRSHLTITSKSASGNLEIEPRSAKLEFNAQPFTHKTEVSHSPSGLRVISKTTRDQSPYVSLDSHVRPWTESSTFSLNSPFLETQLIGSPSRGTGKIQINSKQVAHESSVDWPKKHFQTNTAYKGALIAKVNAQLHNAIDVEIPQFVAKSNYDFGQRSASVDYRSKLPLGRHVLASIGFQNNGFHSDIAWDADKDPNQRLVLDIEAHREGNSFAKKQLVYSASATYAGNEARVSARMTSGEPWRGPHEAQLKFAPKYNAARDAMSLSLKHEIHDNEMQCALDYSEGERHKLGAKFNAKLETQSSGSGVSLTLETTALNNPDLEMKVSFVERHSALRQENAQIFAELKALKTSLNKEFLFRANIKREDNQLTGTARVETPESGPQDLEFVLEPNQLKAWSSAQSGKQLELNAQFHAQHEKADASLELKSNVQGIPSVSAQGVLSPEQVALTVDADQQRKVDFSIRKSGHSIHSGVEVSGRLETSYWPRIETKNSLKYNSNEIRIQSNVKYDFKEISSLEVEANKQSGVWSGKARVAANGAELAKASIESSMAANAMSYVFEAKTRQLSPIKAQFSEEKISAQERKWALKVCSAQDQCIDAKTQWKFGRNAIPEKAQLSVSKMGTNLEIKTSYMEELPRDDSQTSLLGVSQQRANQRIRNQLFVSVNSHALGFDSIQSSRSHGYDANIRFHLPSNRVIQIKTDFANRKSGAERDVISKSQLIVDQSAPLLETAIKAQVNDQRVNAHIEISSPKFRRSPKTVSFEMQRSVAQKPFQTKVFLDLSNDSNDALTIESRVIQRSLNSNAWTQQQNTTLDLSLSTRDKRKLDFQMSAHMSPVSAGVHYRNVNRRGVAKSGSLLVKKVSSSESETRFSALAKCDDSDYSIDATVANNALEMQITNQKTQKRTDVRVALDKQCARIETQSAGEKKRFDVCAHLNNRDDKIVSISLETDDKRSAEFSLELDQALRAQAQWDPRALQQWSRYEWSSSVWSELWSEVKDKSATILKQTESALMPLSDGVSDLAQELFQHFQWMRQAQDFCSRLARALDNYWQQYTQYTRHVGRALRKQCSRSTTCYSALYALEKYGLESWMDLVTANTVETLKRTHRLVMSSRGQLEQFLPDLSTIEYFENYRQSIASFFNALIDSNDDLRQLSAHVQTIGEQMAKNTDQIDFDAVKKAFRQMAQMLFSSSAQRVVVWDPQRGKASLVVRAPQTQSRRLRAAIQNVTEDMQRKDSIKSMFF